MAQQQAPRSERTEKPTPRRIEKAWEKGNVPRSQEVAQLVSLGVLLIWFVLGGSAMAANIAAYTRRALAFSGRAPDEANLLGRLADGGQAGVLAMAPLLVPLLGLAIAAQFVQTGFHVKKEPLKFDWNKLDPVRGLRNFVNATKLVAAAKAAVKLSLYAAVVTWVIVDSWPTLVTLARSSVWQIAVVADRVVVHVLRQTLILGLAITAIDVLFSRRQWYRGLYMTKKEVRDDLKESEGDPLIRSQRRRRHLQLAQRRMMAAVPEATVVVTNPTHVAVALRYDSRDAPVPVVVAKGRGAIAARIREIARQHGVPLVEDPPLARALEKLCDVGQVIPANLYRAVAEVIAWVAQRGRRRYRPAHDLPLEPEAGARTTR
ncbi:MAG: EscU/YscU/HrcU family type III secretion system export apparatus switch protein [Acidobacteria bacterium]|nr:MAG: EscU/YscU/HrcU family type III secretion system export apparatus switch protein [Acidobacteriota bacterium]